MLSEAPPLLILPAPPLPPTHCSSLRSLSLQAYSLEKPWAFPSSLPPSTGIAADLDALRDERKIFTIHNPPDKDNQPRDAVFPAELMGVRVDEDIITQVGGEGGEGPL